MKAQRGTAVEVSELGGKPWVSAILSSPIWIDARDRTHVQRTTQVRPAEAAWSLSVESQLGAQAARIDTDCKQVINIGEEKVGDHHRLLMAAKVDESLFGQ